MKDDYRTIPKDELPPRPAFLNRFWMVFVQPGDLFKALARNPAWFPMSLLLAAVAAAMVSMIPSELLVEQAIANSPGTPAADLRAAAMFIKVMGVGTASLATFVMPFIISAGTFVILVFMRGDEATYRQHLTVVVHAGIISFLGGVVNAALGFVSGNASQTGLSVATFFPFLSEGFLFYFLSTLQLFGLWALVVGGIGLAAIDPRRSAGPTVGILLVVQLVLSLGIAAIWAAFTTGF